MKKLVLILSSLGLMCFVRPAWGQLAPPNAMGVSMSAFYLSVRNVDADVKFFTAFGGTPMKIDGTEVIKFPDVFIFLTPGTPPPPGIQKTHAFCDCPDDGFDTSLINHIGFSFQNLGEAYAKFQSLGYQTIGGAYGTHSYASVIGPDGLMVEISESKSLTTPVGQMHIHTFVNDLPPLHHEHQVVGYEMFLWYHQMFGTELEVGRPGSGLGDTLPGMLFEISNTRLPVDTTAGHVVDHIGFEVTNLQAFCKRLQENGVPLAQPYSTTRHASYASCGIVDPWGTVIELTEGLRKF
jgi:hypothetical protein